MQTSLQFYKIIHIVSIVLFFAFYGISANRAQIKKSDKILTGVLLILILVAGFGLLKYIGISHGTAWPLWIKLKLTIFLIIGATAHMSLKRFPQYAMKIFWFYVGLLTLASYLANYKIQ
jgi:uncharacterized membrane protein SirB2